MKLKYILLCICVMLFAPQAMPQGKVTRNTTKTATKPSKSKTTTKKPAVKTTASNKLIITRIELANIEPNGPVLDNFGKDLHASTLKMAMPKLFYQELSNSITKTVYVKLIKSDGTVERMTTSPAGFTWRQDVTFNPGSDALTLLAYGSSSPGWWTPGTYAYEFWIDGQMAARKDFVVY